MTNKNIKVPVNITVTLANKEWILRKVREWGLRGEGAVIDKLITKQMEREGK